MKPWLKILVGLVLGVIAGLILNRQVEFLSLVGKAFIDLLKMLVGLIVFSSLVTGMCHINDPKKLGRIGARTLIFYAVTTIIAIGFGLIMVYAIQPGKNLNYLTREMGLKRVYVNDFFFLGNFLPAQNKSFTYTL